MPTEDQNSGETSIETSAESQDTPLETSPDSLVIQTDQSLPASETPPTSTVADALAAFETARTGSAVVTTPNANGAPPANAAAKTLKRDYSGLEEHEKEYFSRMSSDAYKYLYPRHLKTKEYEQQLAMRAKEIEELKNSSLYEQEGAWQLAPEYNQLAGNLQKLQEEASFWQDQMANYRSGNKVRLLIKDADGEIRQSDELDPTTDIEKIIDAAKSRAYVLVGKYEDKVQQFTGGYKQQHKDYVSTLQETRSKIFAGADMKKLEAAASKKLEMFPAFTRNKPEVKMLAEALAIIDGFVIMANANKNKQQAQTIKNSTARAAGPTSDSIQTASNNGVKTVKDVMEDFRRAKEGMLR